MLEVTLAPLSSSARHSTLGAPRPRPLVARLPNVPARFVGRAAERAALDAAIRAQPLTIVRGPAGVGKSTLVTQTLWDLLDGRPSDRIAWVDARAARSLAEAVTQLLAAVTAASGARPDAVVAQAHDVELYLARAIDIADEAGLVVAIDGLDGLDAAATNVLFASLSGYARRARFVVSTRAADVSRFLACVIVLGALPDPGVFEREASAFRDLVGKLGMAQGLAASGHLDAAMSEALAVRVAARHARHFGLERATVSFCADLYTLGGRVDDAVRCATELVRTEARDVDDVAEKGRVVLAVLAGNAPAWGVLERVAASSSVRGRGAVAARALLDPDYDVPAFERAVANAALARVGVRLHVAMRGPMRFAPGWGLDVTRRVVWCEDGATIDVGARTAHLLEVLAYGPATKRTLAERVWGVSSYAPSAHDKRMHVAVARLRERLGSGARDRIVTTRDGYALGGVVRIVSRRTSSA